MALNQVHNPGEQFSVPADAVTTPTGEAEKVSGAPALVGELPVVLLTSPEEDSTGVERVTVKTNGIWEFPVEAADGAIAIGDRVEGDEIKLTRDSSGQHHYIPSRWVTRVDDKVHVDRPGEQAMREWRAA